MTPDEEPTGTAPGHCRLCGAWASENRIVREIHSDSGAGATIVQCPVPCSPNRPRPSLRRHPTQPRTYPG